MKSNMKNHNYTGKYDILGFGHRTDGMTLMSGRGPGICKGDTLTIKHHDGQTAKYEVQKVEYPWNDCSLWAVDAKFVEYMP